jgi:TP901 family phage tail tape measure protein
MAVKTIETRAVISAQDRTGSTFSQVGQKVRGLESNIASASRRMDAMARGMSSVGTRMREHASVAARMSAGAAPVAIGGGRWIGRLGGAAASGAGKIREGLTDFASYAMPGAAGYAMGMGGAAVGGLAAGAAATYGLKKAISFDTAMADVKKKVNFGPGESIADVENMINRKSLEMGMSRENLAALAAQAGQSGIAFKDLAKFMDVAANSANAWDVDSKGAAQTLAEVRAQTGWNNKELEQYADKVNYLGDISSAAEKSISEMWSRASAGAKAAGLSYDDSMAFLTGMRSVGMDQEVSSRGLQQIASKLRTATTLSKDGKAALKEIGFTPRGVEKDMARDGAGTLLKVLDAVGKAKDNTKVAQALFGKEWYDEALRMKEALTEISRLRKELASGNWAGSLAQAQKITKETTQNHLDRFSNLMSIVGDKASRWALPPINNQIETMLRGFNTATDTGFLPGANGLPIDRLADKTPVPFSAGNRALFLGGSAFDRMRKLSAKPLSFGVGGFSGGTAGNVVVPGSTAFGLGGVNEGAASALRTAPANLAAALTAGGGQAAAAPAPVARLEGAAEVTNKIIVEPSPDFIVRVEQSINARGALRNDAGVTMQP